VEVETCSQLPPLVVTAVAVKLVGRPFRMIGWLAGSEPPIVYANVSDCGLTPIEVTAKVTGTVTTGPVLFTVSVPE
jgi:hypothetical protein